MGKHSRKGDILISKILFIIASVITLWGVAVNITDFNGLIATTGTMAMNSFYLLGMTLFTASASAKLVWESK